MINASIPHASEQTSCAVLASAIFTINLFRTMQLHWHGKPLPLPARRHPHRLLALLLLECHGISRERDVIAERLWPLDDIAVTRARLRLCLHGLSQCLPAPPDDRPWISRDGTQLCWRGDAPCAVDVWDLDAAYRAVARKDSGSAADHRQRIAQLKAATGLYSGPLLPQMDDSWLVDHRAHYDATYRRATAELIECLVAVGDTNSAFLIARRLILHDPGDESAHVRLIHLHLDVGDRDAALRQFDTCVHELGTLGLSPSYDLTSLASDIRSGKVITASVQDSRAHTPTISSTPPADDTVFVDLQQRLDSIVSVLHRSRLTAIVGVCGSGKSRVAREMARAQLPMWQTDGLRLYWHDCDRHITSGYDPPNSDNHSVSDAIVDSLALTLGLSLTASPRSSFAGILDTIGESEVMLVLDNIDLQLEAWTNLVGALLAYCRRLRILYTSCAPMRFPGEFTWRVPLLTTGTATGIAAPRSSGASSSNTIPGATSEAVQLYCALGGRLPNPLDRMTAASAIDTWATEAGSVPLAVTLLANLSQVTTAVPPDPALRASLWLPVPTAGEHLASGATGGQPIAKDGAKPPSPLAPRPSAPMRHGSLHSAFTHTLAPLSPNARLLLSILHATPPPLTPRSVQDAFHARAAADHPDEAAAGVYADIFDKANAHQPITGEWIDGLIELEATSIIEVTMREGQSTVYRIRDGIQQYLEAMAEQQTRSP